MPLTDDPKVAYCVANADDALVNSMVRDTMWRAVWQAAAEKRIDLNKSIVTITVQEKPAP